jgi:cysteine desulfurase
VTYLTPNAHGEITPEAVAEAVREDTILVSLMHANNEIGVITDLAAIGAMTREKGILFHVDAAQTAGKVEIDVNAMNIDLLSISGHKLYGPKGIGVLYVRRKPRVRIEAQMHGGGHERGMRSGTLATHQIVGIGEAARIAKAEMAKDQAHSSALRQRLLDAIADIEEIHINGDSPNHLHGLVNVSFNYVEGESLIMSLKDLALSSGSACTSASLEPSYVLRALGLSDELAHSSLRMSVGRFSTEEEVDYAAQQIHTAVEKLRELSPLWDMYKDGVDLSTIQWSAH